MSQSFPLEFILQVKNEMGGAMSEAEGQIDQLGQTAEKTGQKTKQATMSIGQAFQFTALNAFNLATSVISTKRSYEDLGRQEEQLTFKHDAVTKAALKLEKAHRAVEAAKPKGKNSREYLNALGTETSATLNLKKAQENEKFAQVDLNRAKEDFYLNIIPNVISGIGTMAGIFQVVQGAGGIGGLTSAFTKFGPIALGIGATFTLLKTNAFGITDTLSGIGKAIGDALPFAKPFLELLKSIGGLFGIGGGGMDLNTALGNFFKQFDAIKNTAKQVIDSLMKGDWSGAFGVIKTAAANAWSAIKTAFPLLGDISNVVGNVITMIKAGAWREAFDYIAQQVGQWWRDTGWPGLLQLGKDIANAILTGIKDIDFNKELTGPGGPIEQIKAAFSSFQQGDIWSGVTGGGTGFSNLLEKLGIGPFAILSAINDSKQRAAWGQIGTAVLNAIKGSFPTLTTISRQFIDPLIVSMFKAETWIKGVNNIIGSLALIGKSVWNGITSGITHSVTSTNWTSIASQFYNSFSGAVVNWINTNLPETAKIVSAIGNNIGTALSQSPQVILDAGKAMMMSLVDAMKKAPDVINGFMSWLGGELMKRLGSLNPFAHTGLTGPNGGVTKIVDTVNNSPMRIPALDVRGFESAVNTAAKWYNNFVTLVNFAKLSIQSPNISAFNNGINAAAKTMERFSIMVNLAKLKLPAVNLGSFNSSINSAIAQIHKLQASINSLHGKNVTNTITTIHRTIYAAKGLHAIVSGATPIIAGEAGPEQVDITPLKGGTGQRTQHALVGGSRGGLGGRPIIIHNHLEVDGREIAHSINPELGKYISQFR